MKREGEKSQQKSKRVRKETALAANEETVEHEVVSVRKSAVKELENAEKHVANNAGNNISDTVVANIAENKNAEISSENAAKIINNKSTEKVEITTNEPSNSEDNTFETLGLSEPTMQAIGDLGFTHMTPVQAQSIPAALTGRDILGAAKTV